MLIRLLSIFCFIIFITGCATLELLSLGVSGVSYIVSGKSLSDNIVSAMIDEDCALHRLVLGEQICFASGDAGTMIAAQQAKTPYLAHVSQVNLQLKIDEDIVGLGDNQVINDVEIALAKHTDIAALDKSQVSERAGPPLAIGKAAIAPGVLRQEVAKNMTLIDGLMANNALSSQQAQVYVVIGSFNQLKFAQERQLAYLNLNAEVIINNSNSQKTQYRVVVGPFTNMENEAALAQLLPALEKFQPWRIKLCARSLSAPPCDGHL